MIEKFDMIFEDDKVPDFGTIKMIGKNFYGVRQYVLLEKDVSKLNIITNAYDGSAAMCVDTGIVYVKSGDNWYKQ